MGTDGRAVELPQGEAVFLDHLAHWVPDIHGASTLLERLGFLVTPYAEHSHGSTAGEAPVPAGSANQCVMLEAGYLEVLTPIGDTPIAREVRSALGRYTGLHLAAFAADDAAAHRERLVSAGFPQRPCVALARESTTADGDPCTLRFTVVRPEVGTLAEGRVQFLTHHTPDDLWQSRWLAHPNTARALTDMVFCVADPWEASQRYERYLQRRPEPIDGGYVLQLERGRLTLVDAERIVALLPQSDIPCPPCMAAYAIDCKSLESTRAALRDGGIAFCDHGPHALSVPTLPGLGGAITFTEDTALPPWLVRREHGTQV
jgi:hypothetical protein